MSLCLTACARIFTQLSCRRLVTCIVPNISRSSVECPGGLFCFFGVSLFGLFLVCVFVDSSFPQAVRSIAF